jgi:sigma-E factor negative regulatory protein RseC
VRRPIQTTTSAGCLSIQATVYAAEAGGVELEFLGSPACAGCAGMCTWRRLGAAKRQRFPTSVSPMLRAGDTVSVSLPANYLLLSSLLLHGLPLLSLLLGGLLGALLTNTDAGCLAGATGGLLLMLATTPRLRRRIERRLIAQLRLERLA